MKTKNKMKPSSLFKAEAIATISHQLEEIMKKRFDANGKDAKAFDYYSGVAVGIATALELLRNVKVMEQEQ